MDELMDAKKRDDQSFLNSVQARGTVRILDKDGNLKSELEVRSIDLNEDYTDATE